MWLAQNNPIYNLNKLLKNCPSDYPFIHLFSPISHTFSFNLKDQPIVIGHIYFLLLLLWLNLKCIGHHDAFYQFCY